MDIGYRIKRLRELKKLTQEELGLAIGVNKATINRYETGVIDIKRTTALKLASIFDVSPAYIMGWEDAQIKNPTFEYILNQKEIEHIKAYRKLNHLGQNKVDEYLSDLSEQNKYTAQNDIATDIANELKQIVTAPMSKTTPLTK